MYLNVTAHTPVGCFKGYLNQDTIATKEELATSRDTIERKLTELGFLVIMTKSSEVCLPGNVIKNSVFVFSIDEKPLY